VLDYMPGWKEVMHLPLAEKLHLFQDRDALERLDRLAQRPDNMMADIANWGSLMVYDVFAPENEAYAGHLIGEIAIDQGRNPWDVLCDIARADELNTSFGTRPTLDSDGDWAALRMDLPGHVGRLYAEADGVEEVFVNGGRIVRRGVLTETRRGTMLRSGVDTATPTMSPD
jgi:hypothetical protein